MIGYHWSPRTRQKSITRRGLLVLAKPHVNVLHINKRISMGRTPNGAWELSGMHMARCGRETEHDMWDLWQVDLRGFPYRLVYPGANELCCYKDIPKNRVRLVAERNGRIG